MPGFRDQHDHETLDSILQRRLEQLAARGERTSMVGRIPRRIHGNE